MKEKQVGVVEHWFGHINVAGVKATKGPIEVGDVLHYKGHTTDFEEQVVSIQKKNKSVPKAKKGEAVGIKVVQKVREHDKVFKVTP